MTLEEIQHKTLLAEHRRKMKEKHGCLKVRFLNSWYLLYKAGDEPTMCLYGIIEKDADGFLYFRTGKRHYTIAKSCILSLTDTDVDFVARGQEEGNDVA